MNQISHIDTPEQGQLVEVRKRRYIVSELTQSALPTSTLPQGNGASQTLVSLTSIEDDALGEELQVIWELEPGARVYDRVALPEILKAIKRRVASVKSLKSDYQTLPQ